MIRRLLAWLRHRWSPVPSGSRRRRLPPPRARVTATLVDPGTMVETGTLPASFTASPFTTSGGRRWQELLLSSPEMWTFAASSSSPIWSQPWRPPPSSWINESSDDSEPRFNADNTRVREPDPEPVSMVRERRPRAIDLSGASLSMEEKS